MRKYMILADLKPYELLIPPGPDPYRAQWRNQINQARVQEAIRQAAVDHPGPALAVTAIAALRCAHIR